MEGSEHSKAVGAAGGDLTQIYNPQTRQMEWAPKSSVLSSNNVRPAPTPTRGQVGPGSITTALSGGAPAGGSGKSFAAAPPLGDPAAANTYATSQAQAAAAIQDNAREAPQRINALRDMQHIINSGLVTGPAQKVMQDFGEKHGINFLTSGQGFVFNKDAARYTAQLAGAVGLNGSDARLGLVGKATPGMQMPKAALDEVLPTYIGLEMAGIARAQAQQQWTAQNGPGKTDAFESEWRRNYDPRVFTQIAKGPQMFQQNVQHLNPQSRQYYLSKLQALRRMGVDINAVTQ
ncbi:hypothetical protein D3Y57_14360 [Sphingomonas paeninsulae]|uniref:Uncharacterized protein n=1 Tax=Sphingomonas paeninsulae TaxID=2319844 RepID=A0A494TM59_SPHPE|nr:hypothetical protein [Sphingomonas paeninsulae]AYJ86906.1 hypothetical protein D3Y57_14360 [Sphingomonas paeninsulae]